MPTNYPIHYFFDNNRLSNVVRDYLIATQTEFNGLPIDVLSNRKMQRFIRMGGVYVNDKKIPYTYHPLKDNDVVSIKPKNLYLVKKDGEDVEEYVRQNLIEFKVKKSLEPLTAKSLPIETDKTPAHQTTTPQNKKKPISEIIPPENNKPPIAPETPQQQNNEKNIPIQEEEDINLYILDFIKAELDCDSEVELITKEPKAVVCFLVELYYQKGFEALKQSDYSYLLANYIKDISFASNLDSALNFPKKITSFPREIIEHLINARNDKIDELTTIAKELKGPVYRNNLHGFLREYGKIISHPAFRILLEPMLTNTLHSRSAIESLIKPINNASSITDKEQQYLYYQENKKTYHDCLNKLQESEDRYKEIFIDLASTLLDHFTLLCDAHIEKRAIIEVLSTTKKYNLRNKERKIHDIFLRIRNTDQGLAKNVTISCLSDIFEFDDYCVGLLKYKDLREITLKAKVLADIISAPSLHMKVTWDQPSGGLDQIETFIKLDLQEVDTPWEKLALDKPYSLEEIEDEDKLYGRDEILAELKTNILSRNIDSYKIWGQKRVGKSSIVKTLKSLFNDVENVIIVYRNIKGPKNPDPYKTLKDLGESICSELLEELKNKTKSRPIYEKLSGIEIPAFDGSLFPLEKFIHKIHTLDNELKFVFILDEFDKMNEEFFMATPIGEAFSGSLGKSLNQNKHVGFILVGSEDIQIMDRHSMNYNSYRNIQVDTFKRETMYSSFKNIITGPGHPYLFFTDECIETIFECTNGNPYFANKICSEAFSIAYKNRDAFIDVHLIEEAINAIIQNAHKAPFEHFWGDGLLEENTALRNKTIDIRKRILVSYAMSTNILNNSHPSRQDILKNFKYPDEVEIKPNEVLIGIDGFFKRNIFCETNHHITIKPALFETWLCTTGKSFITEGVADLEALHKQIELEKEYELKDSELIRVNEKLLYDKKRVTLEKYKEYFKQFGNAINQRRVFKLLDSIYYLSQEEIDDFFSKEQKNIFLKSEQQIKKHVRKPFREDVELYCFEETIEENEAITNSFKLLSHIRTAKKFRNLKTEAEAWKKINAKEIIIIEPVIADSDELIKELIPFLTAELIKSAIPIRLVTLLITTKAKTNLVKATSAIPNFKLVAYREVEETKIKPFITGTELFENEAEATQVFSEVRKIFPVINRESCLNVLFGSLCPGKSSPILWQKTEHFKPIFFNEFGKINENEITPEEQRRARVYHANTKLSQAMNAFIVQNLKDKAQAKGIDPWFTGELIPIQVITKCNLRWTGDKCAYPIETYLDFLDYKVIIEKHTDLLAIFKIPEDGIAWCDTLNRIRRDPAHPEKPAPSEEDAEYFETVAKIILANMQGV